MHGTARWLSGALTIALAAPAAAVDLTGHWRVEGGVPSPTLVDIIQAGATVTIPSGGFSGTAGQLEGTVAAAGDVTLAGSGPCTPFEFRGRLLGNENILHGTFASSCPLLTLHSLVFTRCGCFDGNTTLGDGCDDTCQVEPCFTCGGEPSICAPDPDGSTCDDRRDCTSGETCSAGACGGGSPVSPCVDVSGRWLIHDELVDFDQPLDYVVELTQRDALVRWNSYLGPIDLATGSFALEAPNAAYLIGGDAFTPLTGSAGPVDLTGNGFRFVGVPTLFPTVITGVRPPPGCGDGVVGAGEGCDDGNNLPGDGCTATCTVEPCFACGGAPSMCSNAPRTSCRTSTAPERAVLKIENRAPDTKDLVGWKWPRGDATSLVDLGDPVASDDYTFCLFDESAATPAVLLAATAPAGGTCAGKPCWSSKGTAGFKYTTKDAIPDGLTAVTVKAGEAGKSQASVKGKGARVGPPALPLPLPLRVQLQVENGACLEARYDAAGVRVNDAGRGKFKARASAAP